AFARPDHGGLGARPSLGCVLDAFVDRHDRAAVLVMAGDDAADRETHRTSSLGDRVTRNHSPDGGPIAIGGGAPAASHAGEDWLKPAANWTCRNRKTDMTPPAAVPPPYKHAPLFPLGADPAPYRKLTADGVRSERVGGHDLVVVEREALRALAEAAFTDINHLLRPGHLKQLRAILDDPQASDNDKFVAYDFLKNANIAAGGVLPMCQDTGTAIIMGKKGRLV